MESKAFTYQYSPQRNKEVLSIRKKYLKEEESPLEQLKRLDAKVQRPANLFAYVFGSISAIIMGVGMSLIMTDVGTAIGLGGMMPGILIGVVGLILAVINYPLSRIILKSRKRKYTSEILTLSDQIMNT